MSKKCNGNHEHGPCAGRETKETQLYTSIIVGVILRRFRARAKCLKPAPLKLALACITRGSAEAPSYCEWNLHRPNSTTEVLGQSRTSGAYGELGQSRTPSFKEELDQFITSIRNWARIGTIPWLHMKQLLILGFPGSGEYHQDDCQYDCCQYE